MTPSSDRGLIFDIKRFSINDGPGIRTTIFFKGCPLSCWWCHNPEGISPGMEPVMEVRKLGDKEFRFTEDAGRYYTVEEIIKISEREHIFLQQSGGGITFSGGEPMSKSVFLTSALKELKGYGYHTAIDTSGYASVQSFRKVISFTDLFLYDIKHLDDEKHIKFTGVSNRRIIGNLKFLLDYGKDVFIRFPVIPGINDDKEHLSEIGDFIAGIKCSNLKRIDLLPFHRIGTAKYRKVNLPYRMEGTGQPGPERMKEVKDFFSGTGVKVRIGG
jgi:pyruvate formate lyase activating enzyme